MPPTRRSLLRDVGAASAASAGLLGSAGAAGDSTVQAQSTADFCPQVGVTDLRVDVTVPDDQPTPDALAIHFEDGTVREFASSLGRSVSAGYAGRDDAYRVEDDWYGPIVRAEVTSEQRTLAVGNDPELEVTCSLWRGQPSVADFTTIYENAYKRYDSPRGAGDYGSPGRRLLSVDSPHPGPSVDFDSDCEPADERAVTFDCTSVTVEPEEFVNGVAEIHRAILTFADGTQQTVETDYLEYLEPPLTFAGTGEHEGEVVANLLLYNDPGGRVHFSYDNDDLAACLDEDAPAIVDVSLSSGPYAEGDSVGAHVTVRNATAEDEECFLGFSALGPDGGVYNEDGQTGRAVTVPASTIGRFAVDWIVEEDAPSGSYDAHVALWEETDRDALETQIDDRILNDAFVVE